jgi:hypothetical protein
MEALGMAQLDDTQDEMLPRKGSGNISAASNLGLALVSRVSSFSTALPPLPLTSSSRCVLLPLHSCPFLIFHVICVAWSRSFDDAETRRLHSALEEREITVTHLKCVSSHLSACTFACTHIDTTLCL